MRRRLVVWLVGSALLAVVVFLVGCAVQEAVGPTPEKAHPQYATGTACNAADCHDDYTHEEPYLGACEGCHALDRWSRITYAHKDTTFDNGMHPLVGCSMCHTEGEKLPTGGCATCHTPKHGGSKLCTACHTAVAWRLNKPRPAWHVSLGGGHDELDCQDCHTDEPAPATARQCTACHGTNHGGLTACQDCHTPDNGWEKPKDDFDHDAFFPRVGAHAKLDCNDCHKNGEFANTPRVCVGCHGKKHGGLTDCGSCHTTSTFVPATFRHTRVFTLTGKHADLDCGRCHPNREFARVIGGGSHRCTACHGTQHGGLTECGDCHTTSGFKPANFNHDSVFNLVGKHQDAYDAGRCTSCHPGGAFAVVAGTHCVDCHSAGSVNPPGSPHAASVPSTCQTCHTAYGFDQIIKPYETHPIALGTKHTAQDCTLCHTSLVFSEPIKPCGDCHVPPHVGPTDCRSCHTPTVWSDVRFAHPAILGSFMIPGYPGAAHDYDEFGGYPSGCAECHTNPGPDFTAYSCIASGCHQ